MDNLSRDLWPPTVWATPPFAFNLRKDPGKPLNEPQDPGKTPQSDPQSPGDFPNDQPVRMPGQDRPGTTRPDQESTEPEPDQEPNPREPGRTPGDLPGNEPDIMPGKPGGDKELDLGKGGLKSERSLTRDAITGSSQPDLGSNRSSQFLSPKKTRANQKTTRRRHSSGSQRKSVDQRSMTTDTNPQGNSRSPRRNVYDKNER